MANFWQMFSTTGPRWLRTGFNLVILESIGLLTDHLAQRGVDATDRHFPGAFIPDALSLIGADRRIRRGPEEDTRHYSDRLPPWLDNHQLKGNPFELLRQVHSYFEDYDTFQIDLVYPSGKRFIKDAAGNVTTDTVSWDLDTDTASWARWAMFFRVDVDLPIGDSLLYELLDDWNSAHCIGVAYVMFDDSHVWAEPGLEWGSGTWTGTPPRIVPDIGLLGVVPVTPVPEVILDTFTFLPIRTPEAAPADSLIVGANIPAIAVTPSNTDFAGFKLENATAQSFVVQVHPPLNSTTMRVTLHGYSDAAATDQMTFETKVRVNTTTYSPVVVETFTQFPDSAPGSVVLADVDIGVIGLIPDTIGSLCIGRDIADSAAEDIIIGAVEIEFL